MQSLAGTAFEGEEELEFEFEDEWEGEDLLTGLAQEIGQGEDEFEGEWEAAWEFETDGEEFLKIRKLAQGIGGFVQKNAPLLRQVAKVAAPWVGTAVGGPLGGMLGRAASSLLEGEPEDEFEAVLDGEFEDEYEDEFEYEEEAPVNPVAELMAAVASQAATEAEAEAMAGAAALLSISPADRAALRKVLPNLTRGVAVLTRVLRGRRGTRPAVRVLPRIVRGTARTLTRRAAAGQPVTKKTAARVMATQTRRVLSSPRTCAKAMQTNARAARVAAARPAARRPAARRPAMR